MNAKLKKFPWKEKQFYLVSVSFSKGNPAHNSIFYSGYLAKGLPAGYNQIYNPMYERCYTIGEVYSIIVLKELDIPLD